MSLHLTAARQCLVALIALVLGLAACGSAEDTTATDPASAQAESPDDSTDSDHEDEDHDDEDKDHDDDDHGDEGEGSGGLGAHEHGSAELAVAWIGSDVVIDLISPVQNVFGFEYEPETDEDLSIAADRTEALTASGIVTVNESADCTLTEPATTEVEREASHSEISVSWSFSCDNPAEISAIDLTALFAEFPGFEDIDAEWVSEAGQSSAELKPQEPMLRLES